MKKGIYIFSFYRFPIILMALVALSSCLNKENATPKENLVGLFSGKSSFEYYRFNYVGNQITKENFEDVLSRSGMMELLNEDFIESMGTLKKVDPASTPFFDENIFYQKADLAFHLILNEDNDIHQNTYFYYKSKSDSLEFLGSWADNGLSERWNYSFVEGRLNHWKGIESGTNFMRSDTSFYLDVSGSGWHYLSGITHYETIVSNDKFSFKSMSYSDGILLKMVIEEIDYNDLFGKKSSLKHQWSWYDNRGSGRHMTAEFGYDGRLWNLHFYL